MLFTFAQTGSCDEAQIVVQSLDSEARQTLITGCSLKHVFTSNIREASAAFRLPTRLRARALDAAFELDLVTPIQGQDKEGQDFEMTALLAGRGKLVILYDRDGIVYRNERLARNFKLASRVEFETPAAGALKMSCTRPARSTWVMTPDSVAPVGIATIASTMTA